MFTSFDRWRVMLFFQSVLISKLCPHYFKKLKVTYPNVFILYHLWIHYWTKLCSALFHMKTFSLSQIFCPLSWNIMSRKWIQETLFQSERVFENIKSYRKCKFKGVWIELQRKTFFFYNFGQNIINKFTKINNI